MNARPEIFFFLTHRRSQRQREWEGIPGFPADGISYGAVPTPEKFELQTFIQDCALDHLSIIGKPFPVALCYLLTSPTVFVRWGRLWRFLPSDAQALLIPVSSTLTVPQVCLPSGRVTINTCWLSARQCMDPSGAGQSSQGKYWVGKQSIDPETQRSSSLIPALLCSKTHLKTMQASPSSVWVLPSTSSQHSIGSAWLLLAVASPSPH